MGGGEGGVESWVRWLGGILRVGGAGWGGSEGVER